MSKSEYSLSKKNRNLPKKKERVLLSKPEIICFALSWILGLGISLKYYLLHQDKYTSSLFLSLTIIALLLAGILISKQLFFKKGYSSTRSVMVIACQIVILLIVSLFLTQGIVLTKIIPFISSLITLFLSYLLILLVSILLGRKSISFLGINPEPISLNLLFCLGTGVGLLMLITFGLGIAGLLYKWVIYSTLLTLLVLFLFIDRKEIKEIGLSLYQKASLISEKGRFPLFMLSLFTLVMVSCVMESIAPPTSWDTIAYHLKIPFDYITSHRITAMPYNFNANTSHNMEILYTLAMLIKGTDLAQMLNLTTFVLSGIGIYLFGRKLASSAISLLGVGIYITNGWIINTITTADVDMGLGFFFLLGILCFLHYIEKRAIGWIILMGFYTGIGLGIKYIGAFCFMALWLCLFVYTLMEKGKKIDLLLYPSLCLLFFLPWLIKNYYFTGNPVYPELYSIFGGINWSQVQAEQLAHFHKSIGMGRGFFDYLLLPWRISMHGGLDYKYFLGEMTPLFLIFVIFFVLLNREKRYWYLLLVSGVYFILWGYSFQNLRYLVPLFPVLTLLSFIGLNRFVQIEKVLIPIKINILSSVVIAWIIITVASEGVIFIKKVPTYLNLFIGNESTSDYLSRNIQPYRMFNYINKNLSPSAKLLFIWENRGFYCQREYLADLVYESSWVVNFIGDAKSSEILLSNLRSLKVTHILYNQVLGNVFRPSFTTEKQKEDFILAMKLLEDFLGKYGRLIYQNNNIFLFEI